MPTLAVIGAAIALGAPPAPFQPPAAIIMPPTYTQPSTTLPQPGIPYSCNCTPLDLGNLQGWANNDTGEVSVWSGQ
jgi:hypothetical protein